MLWPCWRAFLPGGVHPGPARPSHHRLQQDPRHAPGRVRGGQDSFVWYRVAKDGNSESTKGRSTLYSIAESTGYAKTSPEELVITARPPAAQGPDKDKKCWSRSFTKDVTTGQQRLLTSLICEDGDNWMLGFRVIQ